MLAPTEPAELEITDEMRQAHNVSAFDTYALMDTVMYSLGAEDWHITEDDLIRLAEGMPVYRNGRKLRVINRTFNGTDLHYINYVTINIS